MRLTQSLAHIREAIVVIALCACCQPVRAQEQFSWQSYTSLVNVSSVAVDASGGYWAATAGGAFRVNAATGEYTVYHNINALSTNSLTTMAIDPVTGTAAFAGAGGQLDILSPNGKWSHSLDIPQTQQNPSINAMLFGDSLLFIAAEYGMSTYNYQNLAFISTARHLGSIPTSTSTTALAIMDGVLYVGTTKGLAYTQINSANISDSSYWNVVPNTNGLLPSPQITSLAVCGSYLYIGTARGICYWDGSTINSVNGALNTGGNNDSVVGLASAGDTLFAATNSGIYQIAAGGASIAIPLQIKSPLTSIAYNTSINTLVIGTQTLGIYVRSGTNLHLYIPNCPRGNYFYSVTLDKNDILWGGSSGASNQNGNGLYRYDGVGWRTFTTDSFPQLATNAVMTVSADSLGNIWSGTYGSGLLKFHDSVGTIGVQLFNRSNSPLTGLSGAPDYILVGQCVPDIHNVEWIIPNASATGNFNPQLIAYDPNANPPAFHEYKNPSPNASNLEVWGLTIDTYGTKWITYVPSVPVGFNITNATSLAGVMSFNEENNLNGTGNWGEIGPPQLNSNTSTAVAVDNDGEIWVGSDKGINIIPNPEPAVTDSSVAVINPYLTLLTSTGGLSVTAIVVDAVNNKWIGTLSNGVFVVSPDGSQLLENFTTANSPILSNEILALSFDNHKGIVYIGTPNGLSAVTSASIAGNVVSPLRVGPQPYFVPSVTPMSIYGIDQNAEMKILTVSGRLVRDYAPGDLSILGGAGGWDGKDSHGNWVSTGIYFLVQSDPDGATEVKKFAVIHR